MGNIDSFETSNAANIATHINIFCSFYQKPILINIKVLASTT